MLTFRLQQRRRHEGRFRDSGAAPVTPALAAAWLGGMGGRCSAFIPHTPQAVSNRSGLASTISRHMLGPRGLRYSTSACRPSRLLGGAVETIGTPFEE